MFTFLVLCRFGSEFRLRFACFASTIPVRIACVAFDSVLSLLINPLVPFLNHSLHNIYCSHFLSASFRLINISAASVCLPSICSLISKNSRASKSAPERGSVRDSLAAFRILLIILLCDLSQLQHCQQTQIISE